MIEQIMGYAILTLTRYLKKIKVKRKDVFVKNKHTFYKNKEKRT